MTTEAYLHLQTRVLCLAQAALYIALKALLFLFMYCINNTARAGRADVIEILLHSIGVQKGVKISDSYIHLTYQIERNGCEQQHRIQENRMNTYTCYLLKYNTENRWVPRSRNYRLFLPQA